jgi:hypothetical protein
MRFVVVTLLALVISGSVVAQQDTSAASPPPFKNKMFEISFSGSYVHVSQGTSDGSGVMTLSPRLGIFVWEGLEIEPEAFIVTPAVGNIYYSLNGNISYNFPLQKRALVFLLVGFGFGNLVPMGNHTGQGYESTTLGMLNAGGGIKVMAADNVAIRVECRYLEATGLERNTYVTYTGPYGELTREIDTKVLSVLFGMSLFFGSR